MTIGTHSRNERVRNFPLFFIATLVFGIALSRDSLSQTARVRVKIAYLFAVWPVFMFFTDTWIIAAIQATLSICNEGAVFGLHFQLISSIACGRRSCS